jgi:hypothetical protein
MRIKTSDGWVYIDYKKIAIAVLAVVIIFLLTCNRSKPVPPSITTYHEVHDTIITIDKQYKKTSDSFKIVLQNRYIIDDNNYKKYLFLLNKNSQLLNDLNYLKQPLPDTCKPLQDFWVKKWTALKVISDAKDTACNTTITGMGKTIKTQVSLIDNQKNFIDRYRAAADTCSKALKELEKYSNSLNKRSIFVGVTYLGSQLQPYEGIGINLGLRNKRGNIYEIGAAQTNTGLQFSISYKKTLFKF